MTRPETVFGKHLEPIHHILGKQSPVVATFFLLFSRTFTGNYIDRAVTPCSTGRIRWPMSDTFTSQNQRNSTACSNVRMAWHGLAS
ncbi:MAG: hypothetical protein E5299_00042 [Burkholderia gladioli]|nr:MAG: hypothetical protein E5299_00042 [Burkholderia gladioli]